jgi:hypothetical protein
MGLTRGDKLFFDGADSFYEIAGRSKVMTLKGSQPANQGLKRKFDTQDTTKSKRLHV